jgi:hypothetical protein
MDALPQPSDQLATFDASEHATQLRTDFDLLAPADLAALQQRRRHRPRRVTRERRNHPPSSWHR